uniref:TraX family protein n=1 Tax=uncultured Tyzzerella sp. TaxID=2321398 RepID=UPI002943105B
MNILKFFKKLDIKLARFKILSNFNIKVIAISLMITEHFIKIFLPTYIDYYKYSDFSINLQSISIKYIYPLTALAFPLFCFLIVEGFQYTKNLKKYMLTLLIFGFISEIPLDFAFFLNSPFNKDEII